MAAPADAEPAVAPGSRDPAERRLGLVGLGVFVGSFFVSLLAASILGLAWAAARGLDGDEARRDLGFAVLGSVGLWVGFLVLPLVWARSAGGARRVLGLAVRWTDLPLGLAVGLAATAGTSIASLLLLSATQREALEAKARATLDRASGGAAVLLLGLVLCVATPIAEEVFFRGVLFRSLHRTAGILVALPLAGLVFGLVHYDADPADAAVVVAVQLGLLGLFGVALCLLVQRTGRLGASIVAHATFNSVTVVTLLLQR